MQVTRKKDAMPYGAPNHFGVGALRLQGWEASKSENFWVGHSTFEPGGGTTMEATPLEKVYVVLTGEVTVISGGRPVTLGVLDSCHIPAGEERQVMNESGAPATMLVIMPYPESRQ